ncbi:MAG: hypothetical protein A2268_00380 [Candidatus Raymondbacteria bacterium RifOxyA12_full_50_37]|uniref:DUF4382 domain-containing protein n=1 Tax=Candidatus Raymondbacteria bacterium RIFOXYD12_FULL_49_13 TaxID=1817890 RepID=A0A1F7F390_UNCRA|nr:MAG: hypothetical protein A2268_00380 [Candidatus Raymondbacteria bacterium RifOxyA12_full_50_37]OGJ92773.1 MAG: hypothetical protein A2248_04430 [Candidatus Raymondbacteria bacterium RIFOXYA2_FULL_49_16]OGK00286.1 MAG: hypothetical protein A2350_16625 [Candidatus Raymondbacteria bacterium RifOxyB12_full_50_8]OGK00976.1 MAG: hypothetical protein A2519_17090 [Candidatus Raymondbacteria bacterium RIFOXYD12_FULL_49_13]OGK02460.1 MAG: hypothetical protein A2487_20795 [Candidatus Raymondbacteria 
MKILLFFSMLFFLSCSSPEGPDTAGTGSKTGNAFMGSIYQHTIPAKNAYVLLIPANYDPIEDTAGALLSTITDILGRFTLVNIQPGLYNVEFTSNDSSMKSFLHGISINSNDTTFVSDTLENTVLAKGYIEQSPDVRVLARVFIRGAPYYGTVNSTGAYLLYDMALGQYRIEVHVDSMIVTPYDNIDSLYFPINVDIQGLWRDTSGIIIIQDTVQLRF